MSEVILHLHIPKVGGSTLRDVLFKQYSEKGDSQEKIPYLRSGVYYFPWDVLAPSEPLVTLPVLKTLARDDIRAVLGHFWFGIHAHLPRKSTYITLLRDPADRLISLYHLLVQRPERYGFPRDTGFHDFVTNAPFPEAYNDQTRRIAGMDPGPGNSGRHALGLARENLKRHFTVVGTMERFDETLLLMNRRLGWTKPMMYYPQRQNTLRFGVRTLPRRTLDAIHEMSALDYELYDFANAMLDDAVAEAGPFFANELESLRFAQLAIYNKVAWDEAPTPGESWAREAALKLEQAAIVETHASEMGAQ